MPGKFGPLDRRRVYNRHIRLMSPEQIALDAFLDCASGVQGLCCCSKQRICTELSMSLNHLWDADDDWMVRIRENGLSQRRKEREERMPWTHSLQPTAQERSSWRSWREKHQSFEPTHAPASFCYAPAVGDGNHQNVLRYRRPVYQPLQLPCP